MNNYYKHEQLLKSWLLNAQERFPDAIFFKRDVGLFYTKNKRPIKIGIPGQADVYGFIPHEGNSIWCEIEFKTGNAKQTNEQKNWEKIVNSKNGIYVLVRDANFFGPLDSY